MQKVQREVNQFKYKRCTQENEQKEGNKAEAIRGNQGNVKHNWTRHKEVKWEANHKWFTYSTYSGNFQ